jgi:hypothetical protein
VESPLLLAATVVVMILAAIELAAIGAAPRAAESGASVVTWFRAHGDGVRWFVWATTVTIPVYALMVALLRRLLPRPHRDVFLIGAVLLISMNSLQAWIWAGLALHADALEPGVARALLDVAIFWGPVLTGATTTMIAPVTVAALWRQATLPRWLGALGAVAFIEQAIETITIFGRRGFTEPGGPMNLQLGAGLTLLWMLAFGIWGGLRGRPLEAS